jgi:hypothetical protein
MKINEVKELFENYQKISGGEGGLSYHKMLKLYKAEYPEEYVKASEDFSKNPIQTRDELFRYGWKTKYPEKYKEVKELEELFSKTHKELKKYGLHHYFCENSENKTTEENLNALVLCIENVDDVEWVRIQFCLQSLQTHSETLKSLKEREAGDFYKRNEFCSELITYEMQLLRHLENLFPNAKKLKEFSVGDTVFFEDSRDTRPFEVSRKFGGKIVVKSWFGKEYKVTKDDIYKLTV